MFSDMTSFKDPDYGICHTFHHHKAPKYFTRRAGSRYGNLHENISATVRSGSELVFVSVLPDDTASGNVPYSTNKAVRVLLGTLTVVCSIQRPGIGSR